MGPYLGDFLEDSTVHFMWSTNDASGASVTRSTDGEVRVYKDNGVSQTTTGVANTEDFDGLTGVHVCTITTTDVFYATGANYTVALQGAVIDGETVNAVLAHFSIENRFAEVNVTRWRGEVLANPSVNGVPEVDVTFVSGVAQDLPTATALATVDTEVGEIKAVTDVLPDSGALTAIGTDTARLTAARAGALTDWINDGRLDLLLDANKVIADDWTNGGRLDLILDSINAASAPSVGDIADAVWDEDIEAAHGTDATAGWLLRVLGSALSDETRNINLLDQLRLITAVVEHQRGAHTHQPVGSIFFVDPVNGDTHASGNRGGLSDPYSLVQDCHDNAVTDSNHDLIILLAGSTATPTTLTENVTLSKRYLSIRGPGRDFLWTRTGAGSTITVTADGVELAAFQLNTAGSGTGNGVTVTSADHFRAYGLWINDTQGDGIELTNCDNFIIEQCSFQGPGASGTGHGISVVAGAAQTGNYGAIRNNYINDVQGDGIQIDTTGGGVVDAVLIEHNVIQGCTDDGIDIVDSGCVDTVIRDNRLGNNTSNDIEDAGTTTFQINNEQYANAAIVNAQVLDVLTVDVFSEPVGVPAASASLADKIGWQQVCARNKATQTAGVTSLRNDADSATIATSAISEVAGTFTRSEWA